MSHRITSALPALLFLACASVPTPSAHSVHVELHSEAGWGLRCGSEWISAEGNDVFLARLMRVLDGHPQECVGDLCVVHGVSMRAMEHAINGTDENSVEAWMGGGAYGVGDVTVQRDARGVVRITAAGAREESSPVRCSDAHLARAAASPHSIVIPLRTEARVGEGAG